MSSLEATRADGYYYGPDFDPKRHRTLNKFRRLTQQQQPQSRELVIRFEMPFHVSCLRCAKTIAKGVRFNAVKKTVGKYFSTNIYCFSFSCLYCNNALSITTDPQHTQYLCTLGLRRKVEPIDCYSNSSSSVDSKEGSSNSNSGAGGSRSFASSSNEFSGASSSNNNSSLSASSCTSRFDVESRVGICGSFDRRVEDEDVIILPGAEERLIMNLDPMKKLDMLSSEQPCMSASAVTAAQQQQQRRLMSASLAAAAAAKRKREEADEEECFNHLLLQSHSRSADDYATHIALRKRFSCQSSANAIRSKGAFSVVGTATAADGTPATVGLTEDDAADAAAARKVQFAKKKSALDGFISKAVKRSSSIFDKRKGRDAAAVATHQKQIFLALAKKRAAAVESGEAVAAVVPKPVQNLGGIGTASAGASASIVAAVSQNSKTAPAVAKKAAIVAAASRNNCAAATLSASRLHVIRKTSKKHTGP